MIPLRTDRRPTAADLAAHPPPPFISLYCHGVYKQCVQVAPGVYQCPCGTVLRWLVW